LRPTPDDIYDLVRNLDSDKDGKVNYQDFAAAFRGSDEVEDDWTSAGMQSEEALLKMHGEIKPHRIPEIYEQLNKKKKKEIAEYDPTQGPLKNSLFDSPLL